MPTTIKVKQPEAQEMTIANVPQGAYFKDSENCVYKRLEGNCYCMLFNGDGDNGIGFIHSIDMDDKVTLCDRDGNAIEQKPKTVAYGSIKYGGGYTLEGYEDVYMKLELEYDISLGVHGTALKEDDDTQVIPYDLHITATPAKA